MKISVMFLNGSLGAICADDLAELLEKNVIVAFQRSSELAIVGKDELRSNRIHGQGSWRDRKCNHVLHENERLISSQFILKSTLALN